LASASLNDAGVNKSTGRVGDDRMTTTMMTTSSCCPLVLKLPLVLLSLVSPLGA
jgi:hypothetical protein